MPHITPNLWFDTQSQEAAEFYVSVFPNSQIRNVFHYGDAGPREAGMVMLVDFVLEDPEYLAEPFTISTELDYAPQQRLLRFGCTPEQARRFTFQ